MMKGTRTPLPAESRPVASKDGTHKDIPHGQRKPALQSKPGVSLTCGQGPRLRAAHERVWPDLFDAELRGLVETDIRFATALFEAPAALSGMSSERLNNLRLNAAIAHAPEAAERVRLASEVAELDSKLASVAAEVPRSFYDSNIEKGMASYVDVNAPLATGE